MSSVKCVNSFAYFIGYWIQDGQINTLSNVTKNRCLTTWLHPIRPFVSDTLKTEQAESTI